MISHDLAMFLAGLGVGLAFGAALVLYIEIEYRLRLLRKQRKKEVKAFEGTTDS